MTRITRVHFDTLPPGVVLSDRFVDQVIEAHTPAKIRALRAMLSAHRKRVDALAAEVKRLKGRLAATEIKVMALEAERDKLLRAESKRLAWQVWEEKNGI